MNVTVPVWIVYFFPPSFQNLFSLQTHLSHKGFKDEDKMEWISFRVFDFYQKIQHPNDLRSDMEWKALCGCRQAGKTERKEHKEGKWWRENEHNLWNCGRRYGLLDNKETDNMGEKRRKISWSAEQECTNRWTKWKNKPHSVTAGKNKAACYSH